MKKINSNSLKNNNTKTILLIGSTGSGKSTLANILINKNDNFEEVFEESANSVSKTKNFEVKKVEIDGDNYRIIDTVGFGDTSLEVTKIPPIFSEMDKYIRHGVNYVFFVIKGKFTNEDIKTFNYLKDFFFDEEVFKHTVIIRTNFRNFRKEEKCEEDREELRNESESIANIVSSVKIIHLNNALPLDDEDESIASAKKTRKDSREKLIDYLRSNQNKNSCKPRLGNLQERVRKINEIELRKMEKENKEINE
jgi:GTP-binding protein EngB required for normal cell division